MKISLPQILASAVAAVMAALVASFFGVTGTVVGVAVGSAVATAGTAVFRHSFERTNEVVRQVVAGSPATERLIRPLGRTRPAGTVAHEEADPARPDTHGVAGTDLDQPSGPSSAGGVRLVSVHIDEAGGAETAVARPPQVVQRRVSGRPGQRRPAQRRPVPWGRYAAIAAVVAVMGLGLVTGVEFIAGEPLSALIGVHGSPGSGSSVSHLFGSSTRSTTTTTSTTTATTTSTTIPVTTTTGAASTSTGGSTSSTTLPGGTSTSTSTSTTRPTGGTTSTTGPAG
jgi:hypothetical protein